MKIAYCCKCVYRMDFCKIKMFLEMYVYFMKDIETGFRIHLDMFVTKKNDICYLMLWSLSSRNFNKNMYNAKLS